MVKNAHRGSAGKHVYGMVEGRDSKKADKSVIHRYDTDL